MSRLARLSHDVSRAIPLLIAVTSIAGSVVAWRASVAAGRAADFDREATQQQLRREQIMAELRSDVSEDLRLFALYQSHQKAAVLLGRQATKTAARDPALAEQTKAASQLEGSLARLLQTALIVQFPTAVDADGNATYDKEVALAYLVENERELPLLRPAELERHASREHDKTVELVGVGAVVVFALFFLTIGELARGRAVRAGLAILGGALLVAALTSFALIGP